MFFGYDQGVMSQVNLNAEYKQRMGISGPDGTRNALLEGFIVAIYYGGFCVGSLLGGALLLPPSLLFTPFLPSLSLSLIHTSPKSNFYQKGILGIKLDASKLCH